MWVNVVGVSHHRDCPGSTVSCKVCRIAGKLSRHIRVLPIDDARDLEVWAWRYSRYQRGDEELQGTYTPQLFDWIWKTCRQGLERCGGMLAYMHVCTLHVRVCLRLLPLLST